MPRTEQLDPVAFVDIETSALDRDLLQVWEAALIVGSEEHVWHLPIDLAEADPMSLGMNGFVDRYNDWDTPAEERPAIWAAFAQEFARLTRGLTLVGANPAFDERALWDLLRANGECPMWHYRSICVETLAAGYLRGMAAVRPYEDERTFAVPSYPDEVRRLTTVPWKHTDLIQGLNLNPADFDRHSAIGDARLVKAVYEKVMGR